MTDLRSYSEYAREARNCLSDARDWLNSDWLPGRGPGPEEADGKYDAMVLIRYAKAALDGTFRLTPEVRQALRDLAEEG